jgi:Flp pilus assembly protein TadG/cytoskeletal protein CcmA (bactofilin family)
MQSERKGNGGMKTYFKRENGAVAVLVAICMCVLMGFTALAVDYGQLAVMRQSAQNAADAAALAAAQDLAGRQGLGVIRSTAAEYARVNGFDGAAEGTTVETSAGSDTVTVTVTRAVKVGFAAVLTGRSSEEVSAKAVARVDSIFGHYPYALFAGETITEGLVPDGITITGNNTTIYGDIHSNSIIDIKHGGVADGYTAEAVKTNGSYPGGSPVIEMPEYQKLTAQLPNPVTISNIGSSYTLAGAVAYAENQAKNLYGSGYLTEGLTLHVTGSMVLSGKGNNPVTFYNLTYPLNLVVDGTVTLNGCSLNSNPAAPITLIATGTNTSDRTVTLNGGGTDPGFYGTIFAPNGDVDINGNSVGGPIYGSIIAQNIVFHGGGVRVTYNAEVDDKLPKTKVYLIA